MGFSREGSIRSAVFAAIGTLVFAGLLVLPSGGGLAHATTAARVRSCFGAAALGTKNRCPSSTGKPVMTPEQASHDMSDAYDVRANGLDCWSHLPTFPRNPCRFGSPHGRTTVVLAGNSHAGQWLPALQRMARRSHWKIVTELASQCVMADVTQMFPEVDERRNCRSWTRHAATRVRRDRPDLIVFANRMSLPAAGHTIDHSVRAYAAGMARVFRRWKGIPVVVIRDTPAPSQVGGPAIPACLEDHPDDYAACNGLRSQWVPQDPAELAVKHFKNVRLVNVNNHLCGPRICPSVVGRVIPYFDGSHLTATFARTMAPFLRPALTAALRSGGRG